MCCSHQYVTIVLFQLKQEMIMTNNNGLDALPDCPVETTLRLIGNKWQVLIVRELLNTSRLRFSALQRSVGGISQKVLTANLRTMESTGLVQREVFAEVPPRVEYALTPTGQSLKPVLDAMSHWGEDYKRTRHQGRAPRP